MKNMSVLIIDEDRAYGQRLAVYFGRREDSPFVVRLETDEAQARPESADMVLVCDGLADRLAGRLVKGHCLILDGSGSGDAPGEFDRIYKYQSASALYEKALALCLENSSKCLIGESFRKETFTVTGILTPVRDASCAGALLSLCRHQKSLLYVCLSAAADPVMVPELSGEGLSDLIYYLKQGHGGLGERVSRIAGGDSFGLLRPAAVVTETEELSGAEWETFLKCLREETAYEEVWLDFGAGGPISALPGMCDRLLLLRRDSPYERTLARRLKEMISRMRDSEGPEIQEMIIGEEETDVRSRRTEA